MQTNSMLITYLHTHTNSKCVFNLEHIPNLLQDTKTKGHLNIQHLKDGISPFKKEKETHSNNPKNVRNSVLI